MHMPNWNEREEQHPCPKVCITLFLILALIGAVMQIVGALG